jgi:FlaA1/EpsC-like NDP-sugar epimerase
MAEWPDRRVLVTGTTGCIGTCPCRAPAAVDRFRGRAVREGA